MTGSEPHFPIEHPEYRYPGSNNPYWAKIRALQGVVFTDNETERNAAQWRSHFSDLPPSPHRELHVEIGCNAGHVLVEWAQSHPEKAFIGIDWKFKPIFRAVEKGQKRNLKNLIFLRAHAERLNSIFGPQEVDSLFLFFPDPWPKKSHWKNRLVTAERLRQIVRIMKPNGVFHIKTDHPGYFEWILKAVEEVSDTWKVLEINRDLHQDHPSPWTLQLPEVTLFEKIFIRDQIPIQSLKLQARPVPKSG